MPTNNPDKIPFESRRKKKKPLKQPPAPRPTGSKEKKQAASSLKTIPDEVSKRMVRRMALFSGIPTGLGMSSFFIFYWIVSHDWLEVPTFVVFGISLGLFGLGVVGLSYGIFSTSWDESQTPSWWGWENFKSNFGRTVTAWRSGKAEMGRTGDSSKN
jgi:hypothetical protein